jgi:hypothetical protein
MIFEEELAMKKHRLVRLIILGQTHQDPVSPQACI